MRKAIYLLCMITVWSVQPRSVVAAATLEMSDGLMGVTIVDNGPLDGDPAFGSISYVGTVGFNWVFTITTAQTKPWVGSTEEPRLVLDSMNSNAVGFQPLVVSWTDDGFGPLASGRGFVSSASGSSQAQGSAMTVSTWGDAGNVLFGDDGLTAQSAQFFDTAAFSGVSEAPLGGPISAPYSLTLEAVIVHVGLGQSVVTAVLETETLAVNAPPVAVARDVVLPAGADCTAEGSAALVDDGSFDPDGDPLTLQLTPAGPYALGETLVILTVDDGHGSSDSAEAVITVVDITPPTILCPDPLSVASHNDIPAPDPDSVTAFDACGTVEVVFLADESDGLVGPETITRSYLAVDESGNVAECMQIITVEASSADDLLDRLIEDVTSSSIHHGIQRALLAKLLNGRNALQSGRTQAAANQLQAFAHQVRAQHGKKIDPATAEAWIADTRAILHALPTQPIPPKNGRRFPG